MDYKIVYDREAKKFLTPKQYMGILKSLMQYRYPKIQRTSNGVECNLEFPNYLFIIGERHLPKDVVVESWIVLEWPRENPNGPAVLAPRVACLEFAYDLFSLRMERTYTSIVDRRKEFFEAKGCAPLALDGVRLSSKNFMCNVAALKKAVPGLF